MGVMDMEFALESWRLDLRAQRKRDQTIETYLLAGNRLKKFLVFEGRPTGPCPMASRFWDALPVGWTPASEVVKLDEHIPECIRGNPEILVARVLAEQSGRSRKAEAV
jgi:hypothetical protein